MVENERIEALLARVALGDRAAFRELYDATAAHLLGVAVRILRSRAQAEEALQDAFVQIWQNAATYRAERARGNTWMNSIVRYRALDLLRRQSRELPLDEQAVAQWPDEGQRPDGGAEPRLEPCLEELGEQQRTCVTLAFVEGYSHQELSTRMDTPLGTIKSWVRRGLDRLRECLER